MVSGTLGVVSFWVHYWDASCSYPDRSGDLRGVVTPYDFASERQWLASPLYLDYFRPGVCGTRCCSRCPTGPGAPSG
jgi:hypothetical protein